jgi:hypothetical protein
MLAGQLSVSLFEETNCSVNSPRGGTICILKGLHLNRHEVIQNQLQSILQFDDTRR